LVVAIRAVDGLEIDEDLAFVRRSWTVQRLGWIGMGLVLALALAGLLGSGPLSRRATHLAGLLRVEYQRFARYEAVQTITIRVEPAATHTGELRVWVDRRFLDDSKIDAITPTPVRVEAGPDRLVYVFAMSHPGEPTTLSFILEAEQIGPTSGRIGLVGSDGAASFRQFVYP
jgi:hypothetical protein